MLYALNLGKDHRILSATYDEFAPPSQPRVNMLPTGEITDYKYENGGYVYDPLSVPPEPKLTVTEKIMPGEYFTIDNTIYKATTTIPCGDAVIPGTNCTIVNMADELNKQ